MKIDRRTLLKLLPGSLLSLRLEAAPQKIQGRKRARELGIRIGTMEPGKWNAITDVPGVRVGHSTIIRGSGPLDVGVGPVRTGVTVIWPHDYIFNQYVPLGYQILNGNGEVTGLTQAETLGILGSPVCTTNTSSVGMVYDAVLSQMPAGNLPPVVPVVGETWDAFLNDIEGRHVHQEHVLDAMNNASSGPVPEGNVGGGTGMRCYDFKGGIGTASRKLPEPLEKYMLGVLVQANHGWDARGLLRIDGVPVGEEISNLRPEPDEASFMNSIIIVIATDAPLLDYQLSRLSRRAGLGLAKTGSISSNGSGDFAIAFSTANKINRSDFWNGKTYNLQSIDQSDIEPLLHATSEATEEAIINSLFMATDMVGRDGNKLYALPIDRTLVIMERYHRLYQTEEKKVASL